MKTRCKKCLLREMAEADKKMLDKYKAAVKPHDRVGEACYEERLSACKSCDYLNEGTCAACGCYVELRAIAKIGRCPYHKWEK